MDFSEGIATLIKYLVINFTIFVSLISLNVGTDFIAGD